MKILYVGRLFSGLESSLISGEWNPTGVPTIYRVIERLDRDFDLRLILADKDDARLWKNKSDCTVKVAKLRAPVTVLAGSSGPKTRLSGVLRELRQAWRILDATFRWRPDIIYIDRANAMAAGVLARLGLAPVVLRLLGVHPVMRKALSGGSVDRNLGLRALKWAFRAPFALVICTEDGSGGATWLKQALRPGVRFELMINGVDRPLPKGNSTKSGNARDPRTIVLFVARLEDDKGCDPFMAAFLRAWSKAPDELQAIVVGTGSRGEAMKSLVQKHGASGAVTFLGQVPHAQVLSIQEQADIYVSLNQLGNLSNANLEAMRIGACMILPAYLPEVGAEDPTSRLLPHDAYVSIPDPDAVEELSERLLELHRDPVRRRRLSEQMKAAADVLLPTWERRVDREIDLLLEIAGGSAQAGGAGITRQ